MTDLETFIAMLDRTGVKWSKDGVVNVGGVENKSTISIEEGEGSRNLGYSQFRSVFFFNEDGSLYAVGAWE